MWRCTFGKIGIEALGIGVAVLGVIWLVLLSRLSDPKLFKNLYFPKGGDFSALQGVKGIIEIYETDGELVVKFNSKLINEDQIYKIVGGK